MLPRVLVIEDDGDLRRLLRRGLEEEGFEVVQASLGKDALALAEQDPPDLLVVDIGLPDATGHELMLRIKELYPIKGIALSGFCMDDDIQLSRDAGFSEHLVKPVDLPQLAEAIRRVAALPG